MNTIRERPAPVSILSAGLLLLTVLSSVASSHATSTLAAGANIDIVDETIGTGRQQVEPTIAIDPTEPNILVAGAQDLRLVAEGKHRWHGYYRSTDGGNTWTSKLLPGFPGDNSPEGQTSPIRGFDATTDPVLAIDNLGNVFYAGIAIKFAPSLSTRVFVARYENNGATYDTAILLDIEGFHDKEWVAVDNGGGSETNGNIYIVWQAVIPDLTRGRFTTVFSRSTDHGSSFSPPVVVSPHSPALLPFVTVDPRGGIFVSTLDPGFHHILVSKSTDAGLSFSPPVRAVKMTPVRKLPENLFRVLTIPQIAADNKGIYLVWDDFRTRDSDVLFTRSTDGGMTWADPITVNDVARNHQFFPSIAVSAGMISIVWYDSRLDDGGFITELDVFYAQSENSGESFSPNLRVTSVSFNPNLVARTDPPGAEAPFIGDYIQVVAGSETVHPIWTDNRNACGNIDSVFGCVDQDVFTATITWDP